MGETTAHQRLKWLAMAFLQRVGCHAVATEVECPISRYRVDVAGYLDSPPKPRKGRDAVPQFAPPPPPRRARCEPRTIMIECKQSRSDFLSDRRDRTALLSLRAVLAERQQYLEENWIKVREPWLRRDGNTLFAEFADWDFEKSELGAYHNVLKRIERVEEQLHGETKFCMISKYRLADHLYIAAPYGMISRRELPPGWGLIECGARFFSLLPKEILKLEELPFTIAHRAPENNTREDFRIRLLRNIAVAGTRLAMRHA